MKGQIFNQKGHILKSERRLFQPTSCGFVFSRFFDFVHQKGDIFNQKCDTFDQKGQIFDQKDQMFNQKGKMFNLKGNIFQQRTF